VPDAIRQQFSRLRHGWPNDPDPESWLTASEAELAEPTTAKRALWTNELEQIDKAVLQAGSAPGWYVEPAGRLRHAQPLPGIDMLCAHVLHTPTRSNARRRTVKRHTNQTLPAFTTSDTGLAMAMLIAEEADSWSGLVASVLRLTRMFDEDQASATEPVFATMFHRTGHSHKPQLTWRHEHDALLNIGEHASLYPRRRGVFGVPACVNFTIRPLYDAAYVLAEESPWLHHGTDGANSDALHAALDLATARGMRPTVVMDDVSNMDFSVAEEHQRQLLKGLYAPMGLRKAAAAYEACLSLPILGPGITVGEEGWFTGRAGTNLSGIITTSIDNSLINGGRIITCVAAGCRWTTAQAWARLIAGDWWFRTAGDDSVLVVPDWLDRAAYADASLSYGYKANLVDGAVFLMAWLDRRGPGKAPFGLASRAVIQSWLREREPRTAEVCVLGAVSRLERTTGHPLFPLTERMSLQGARYLDALRLEPQYRRLTEDVPRLAAAAQEGRKDRIATDLQRLVGGMIAARGEAGSEAAERLAQWAGLTLDEAAGVVDLETVAQSARSFKTSDAAARSLLKQREARRLRPSRVYA
jgi:hypothetical protein